MSSTTHDAITRQDRPRLEPDREQIARFVGALFRYAESETFVSLRGFDQHDRTKPPFVIEAVKVNGSLDPIIDTATRIARRCEVNERPIVFAPPVCTFTNPNRARGSDLANGLTLSVEIDDNPNVARKRLETLLGLATVVVESGSFWIDPATGEVAPKLHLHWRLSEPTSEQQAHERLRHARRLATMLAGGDPTGTPPVHPLRWPGTWNRKAKPRQSGIVALNESELHLDEAVERLEDAVEAAGLAEAPGPRKSGPAQAPVELVKQAVEVIPNAGTEIHYDDWIRLGYAVLHATSGSPEGFAIWDAWSAKSDKYDAGETEAAWRRIAAAAISSHTPRRAGAGTIFFLAKRHGWEDPRRARTREEPPPYDDVPPWTRTDPLDSPQPDSTTKENAEKPVIQVVDGQLAALASEGETALCSSGIPIFRRGSQLVRPVAMDVSATNGRTTIAAGLSEVTLHSMLDALSQSASWTKWNARKRKIVPCDPPTAVASVILSRSGLWKVPRISGVTTTPTLRPDGSILAKPGYDPSTHLYHFADPSLHLPALLDCPSRDDALRALDDLKDLLRNFPFVTEVDRSVALCFQITPVVRGALTTAPLSAFRASTAGTGKSYVADVVSAIVSGRPCPVASASASVEETEKRLVGLLLAGFPLISLDNVNGELGGDLLCQAVERPLIQIRPLGQSEIVEIESRATLSANGNNLRVRGDMVRRTVICTLDANMERPELREFDFDPVEQVLADRGRYVAASLTIVRAYMAAGMPNRLPTLASFREWSDLVRSAVVWLGCEDPCQSMEAAREDDPELASMREVMELWQSAFQGIGLTVREIAERVSARTKTVMGEPTDYVLPDLRDALLRISGPRGDIDTRRLGEWLKSHAERIVDGFRIRKVGTAAGGLLRWAVVKA